MRLLPPGGMPASRASRLRGNLMSFSKDSVGNKTREQIIKEQMLVFGMDKDQAEFAAAIESGELESDLIMITPETTVSDSSR